MSLREPNRTSPVRSARYPPVMERRGPLHSIPDDELLRRLTDLLHQSRRTESDLVAHIAEVDERRLYAREASPSMFTYCTQVLHLSEAEAYLRITAARTSLEHPLLLDMLADGRLHLSGIAKLAPHLTSENADALLRRAAYKTKRQIEELIATLAPRPDVPPLMRRLPERPSPAAPAAVPSPRGDIGPSPDPAFQLRPGGVASPSPAPPRPQVVEPLAPGRYKIQFTASSTLHDKLERLQALMHAQVPGGDLAAVIEAAVTEKLERLEGRRFGRTSTPRKGLKETDTRPSTRHIPAAVRRAVHERDGDRCGYVDARGRRCPERQRLEFHHRLPYAMGGDHRPSNVRLACRVHNVYLAEHDYGRKAMARYRRSGKGPRSPGVNTNPE